MSEYLAEKGRRYRRDLMFFRHCCALPNSFAGLPFESICVYTEAKRGFA